MKKTYVWFTSVGLLAATTLTSCDTPEGRGAALGALSGAAIGEIATGHARKGAAIGAISGAVLGHLIARTPREEAYYSERYPRRRVIYEERRYVRSYPYARRLGGGYVESPYPPYATIDVRGIPPGAVVEDPVSGRRFIRP